MRRKHQRTLDALFTEPTRADIAWQDIEALFIALGAEIPQGHGFRVRIALDDVRGVFHRPHPEKEAHKAMVRSVRRFLREAGAKP